MLAIPFPAIDPALFTLGPVELFGLTLGPFSLRWYALAYIFGLVLGRVYVARLLDRAHFWPNQTPPMEAERTEDLLLWMTLGVILGGRLGYVLFYSPDLLLSPLDALAMWKGGMSFHGGMLGVIIGVILFARQNHVPLLPLGDAVACAAPIGLLFGRIANFINGELWGRVTDAPWGMVFPQVERLARIYPEIAETLGQPRHPSQLYEAALEGALLLAVLGHLAWRTSALQRPGTLTGVFLMGYGLARGFCEFFRMPDIGVGFDFFVGGVGITRGQVLCLPMIVAGGAFLWNARRVQIPSPTS
jgi:phosphatidylglycerol:prolipoprotein diacylglycerol transferase